MPAIESLSTADLTALGRLLADSGLPNDDCGHSDNRFIGIRDSQGLVACGGLQLAGPVALLRSIAVAPAHRGKGLGARLVEVLLQQAVDLGVGEVYLLTENSDGYFERLGFLPVERSTVPPGITRTAQFSSLCPDTAICLMKALNPTSTGIN